MFDENLSAYGINNLVKWGVEFLTGKPIKEIKPGVVVYQTDAETGATEELSAKRSFGQQVSVEAMSWQIQIMRLAVDV